MYFISAMAVNDLKRGYWQYIFAIDQASLVIYLFHVSVLYCVLFIFANVHGSIAIYRVMLAFLLGLIIPYAIYHLLSKSVILQFLFGMSTPIHNSHKKH